MTRLHDDPERTSPIGLMRYAVDFFVAARAADKAVPRKKTLEGISTVPAMYLYGHAVELTFKAFLLNSGVSLQQLRSKALGHDLAKLSAESELRGFDASLFDAPERGTMLLLNELYATKQLEYIVTGNKSIPLHRDIDAVSLKLMRAVAPTVGFAAARLPAAG